MVYFFNSIKIYQNDDHHPRYALTRAESHRPSKPIQSDKTYLSPGAINLQSESNHGIHARLCLPRSRHRSLIQSAMA